jgi:hypothetical protein
MGSSEWFAELTTLQDEYTAAKGVTFHSSWDDFLFCKLRAAEQGQVALAGIIVNLGKLTGVVDGTQPLTGPQILLVGADVEKWINDHA